MKKKILIMLGIVALGLIIYFIFSQTSKDKVTIKKTNPNIESGIKAPVINIEEKRKIPMEVELPLTMDEFDIQATIHHMTHQKVVAQHKWGFTPMTKERIERLIEVVETNKEEYTNAEIYADILNHWQNSDFYRVDFEHNTIWSMQGGTIGEATGILSFEEEKDFIKKHFKIEIEDVTSD